MRRCPNRRSGSNSRKRHHRGPFGNVVMINDGWFRDVLPSDLVTIHPTSAKHSTYERQFINGLLYALTKQSRRRLYSGDIRGSRSARVRKVIKNIEYWMRQVIDWELIHGSAKLDIFRADVTDEVGNDYRRYVLHFNKAIIRYVPKLVAVGGLIVDVNARLENVPWYRGILGALSKKFKFLKKYVKFETQPTFVVQMKFWLDEDRYFGLDVAKIPVYGDFQTTKPLHLKEDTEDGHPREKRRIYQFTGAFRAG